MKKGVSDKIKEQIYDSTIRNGTREKGEILVVPEKQRTLALAFSDIRAFSLSESDEYIKYKDWNVNALSQEEAVEEITIMQSLYERLGETKFDLMGLALDFEQCGGSRVYKASQEQIIDSVVNNGGKIAFIQSILNQTNSEEGGIYPLDIEFIDNDVFEEMFREYGGVQQKQHNEEDDDDFDIELAINNAYEKIQREDMNDLENNENNEEEHRGFFLRIGIIMSGLWNKLFNKEETKELPAPR